MTFDISQLSHRFDGVSKNSRETLQKLQKALGDKFLKDPDLSIVARPQALVIFSKKTGDHVTVTQDEAGKFDIESNTQTYRGGVDLATAVGELTKFRANKLIPAPALSLNNSADYFKPFSHPHEHVATLEDLKRILNIPKGLNSHSPGSVNATVIEDEDRITIQDLDPSGPTFIWDNGNGTFDISDNRHSISKAPLKAAVKFFKKTYQNH